jgi:hypothetical protein
MVRFDKIAVIEKVYPYVNATAAAEYKNGTFGTVADGVFTAGATGFYTIMQIEKGDDATSDDFVVNKDEPCRVCDLSNVVGQILNVTSAQLPATFSKGNKMVSKADGTLEVQTEAPTSNYLLVTEVTGFGANWLSLFALFNSNV